jgi:hypothetical protein
MALESSLTVAARERDVASFPALRAIIQAVSAKLHVDLPLAYRAILFAVATAFRLVTLNAHYRSLHIEPP